MAISTADLKMEIGSEAYAELYSEEVIHICQKYDSDEILLAGQKAFEILYKKFQPNYRMGRMYENLSDKFQAYKEIYDRYARSVNAGYVVVDEDDDNRTDNMDVSGFYPW